MALSRPALMLVLATTIGCNGIIGGADGTNGGGPFGGPGGGGPNVAGAVAPNVMHRLNREEYSNTVRDLLQTNLDPAADFPADDVSLGFDNIAQVLSVSPLQFELYEQAAEALAQEVVSGPARGAVVFCDAEESACRDEVLRTLARRAWRRPVTDAEVARLQQLVDVALAEGESVDRGLNLAIRGVLLSPHFVYRPELDDASSASTPRLLNDYELASRLSYFLWSSMPDEALFEAAAAGRLRDDGGIAAEVDRMLADPKADALLDNFAGQWLRVSFARRPLPGLRDLPDLERRPSERDARRSPTLLP